MLFFVFISTHLFAQEAADKVSGSWFNTEATAKIQTAMIIAAALIEGVALFAAVICLINK